MKAEIDAYSCVAQMHEYEPLGNGTDVSCNTLFLANRECSFRCIMCDLWKQTLNRNTPEGAIPIQINSALEMLPEADWIKLYNAGSFFDSRSVPVTDYNSIGELTASYRKIVVESHPYYIAESCKHFSELISGRLEVAIGLESAIPEILNKLNKRFTVEDFRKAAERLHNWDIDMRVFIMIQPPFESPEQSLNNLLFSLKAAFDAGARICSMIPTRLGNGAMEMLHGLGYVSPPNLKLIEEALKSALELKRGLVIVDTWDLESTGSCVCSPLRIENIIRMNRSQQPLPLTQCTEC